jgi:Zn-dependent M28 family amino/carboxypeptidase
MNYLLITLLVLLGQGQATTADWLLEKTTAISQAATSADRRTVIVESLKASGVAHEIQEFTAGNRSGANVVATISAAETSSGTILLGAHLDRVSVGQGAIDNGASCAILLELVNRLKLRPLQNTTVTVAFFDLEEAGLLGSAAYFRQLAAAPRQARAMNLDIFGYGDTLFVAPSMEEGALLASLKEAAAEEKFPLRTVPIAQYPAIDHVNMVRAGLETLGLAIIDGPDIDAISGPGRGRGAPAVPRILTLIHTQRDTPDQVRPQDMAKSVPVLERTLRILDARVP